MIEAAEFLNWLLDEYDGDLSQPEPRIKILNKYREWRRYQESPEDGPDDIAKVYSFRQIAKGRGKIIPIKTITASPPEPA